MPPVGPTLLRRTFEGTGKLVRLAVAPALLLTHRGAATAAVSPSDKESWYKTVTVSPAEVCGGVLMEAAVVVLQQTA